jgi:SAM-dependent methyltransferase
LNFPDKSVSSLILLDVFHHLKYPGTALNEFRRVLSNKGRVIILDPAMGLLGRFVYGLFHHEPLGLHEPIRWLAPDGFDPESAYYFAAQANASRVFLGSEFKEELKSWTVLKREQLPEIAYLASGGFSKPQLYPSAALPVIRRLEKLLAIWPKLFATRLLVVLAKESSEHDHEK